MTRISKFSGGVSLDHPPTRTWLHLSTSTSNGSVMWFRHRFLPDLSYKIRLRIHHARFWIMSWNVSVIACVLFLTDLAQMTSSANQAACNGYVVLGGGSHTTPSAVATPWKYPCIGGMQSHNYPPSPANHGGLLASRPYPMLPPHPGTSTTATTGTSISSCSTSVPSTSSGASSLQGLQHSHNVTAGLAGLYPLKFHPYFNPRFVLPGHRASSHT